MAFVPNQAASEILKRYRRRRGDSAAYSASPFCVQSDAECSEHEPATRAARVVSRSGLTPPTPVSCEHTQSREAGILAGGTEVNQTPGGNHTDFGKP